MQNNRRIFLRFMVASACPTWVPAAEDLLTVPDLPRLKEVSWPDVMARMKTNGLTFEAGLSTTPPASAAGQDATSPDVLFMAIFKKEVRGIDYPDEGNTRSSFYIFVGDQEQVSLFAISDQAYSLRELSEAVGRNLTHRNNMDCRYWQRLDHFDPDNPRSVPDHQFWRLDTHQKKHQIGPGYRAHRDRNEESLRGLNEHASPIEEIGPSQERRDLVIMMKSVNDIYHRLAPAPWILMNVSRVGSSPQHGGIETCAVISGTHATSNPDAFLAHVSPFPRRRNWGLHPI